MAEGEHMTRVPLPPEGEEWIEQPLKERAGRPKSVHLLDRDSAYALNAALVAGRPLLVRGQPGVGKSQLARAAADALGRALVTFTVNSRTETDDLLWHVDLVARLAEAQIAGATGKTDKMPLGNFIRPGPLWWGFDWVSAKTQWDRYHATIGEGAQVDPPDAASPKGVVVLIDEIDKADSAVPNGLLEALGGRHFNPPGVERVCMDANQPLVIFTTNEERHLPDAFLRRCFVHTIALPTEVEALVTVLVERGKAHNTHKELGLERRTLRKAATLIANDRLAHGGDARYRPGVAEYLDLLDAVKGADDADALVTRLSRFVMHKQGERR